MLALRGAHVWMCGRSEEKANAAIDDIRHRMRTRCCHQSNACCSCSYTNIAAFSIENAEEMCSLPLFLLREKLSNLRENRPQGRAVPRVLDFSLFFL